MQLIRNIIVCLFYEMIWSVCRCRPKSHTMFLKYSFTSLPLFTSLFITEPSPWQPLSTLMPKKKKQEKKIVQWGEMPQLCYYRK